MVDDQAKPVEEEAKKTETVIEPKPAKKVVKRQLKLLTDLNKVCGGCTYYKKIDKDQGDCFANPPALVILEGDDGPYPESMRPVVGPADHACRLFEFAT